MLQSGGASNIYFIVFGLTLPWLEPTFYYTRGVHANNYTADAVHTKCGKSNTVKPVYTEAASDKFDSFQFDTTRTRTHDLPYLRQVTDLRVNQSVFIQVQCTYYPENTHCRVTCPLSKPLTS